MKVLSDTASGKAHGKIILIGEHAVVYDQPAIAIPFTSASVEVNIERIQGESTIESIYHKGKISDAPNTIENIIETFEAVCTYFGVTSDNMHIKIESSIPAERGMGSSAAVATALVRALFNFYDERLTDKLLHRFVSISETIAHGNPSGLDAKVVSSNESIYFVRNKTADFFNVDLPGFLVIADTGVKGETGKAVNDVGKLVANPTSDGRKLIQELGQLTDKARQAITEKGLVQLGQILESAHDKLQKITVSNEKLDRLVQTAKENGALGAKLTGGGRGGCMIALVENEMTAHNVASALKNVGATKTWIHPLGASKHDS